MTIKEEIAKLIDSNLKTYRDNPDRFLSDNNSVLIKYACLALDAIFKPGLKYKRVRVS